MTSTIYLNRKLPKFEHLLSLTVVRETSMYKSSSMGSLGLSNLRGVNNGCRSNTSVNWGNQGFWVEGGCNTGVSWGNREVRVEDRETRVSDTESCTISNVFNLLKLTIGINIRVSSSN